MKNTFCNSRFCGFVFGRVTFCSPDDVCFSSANSYRCVLLLRLSLEVVILVHIIYGLSPGCRYRWIQADCGQKCSFLYVGGLHKILGPLSEPLDQKCSCTA